MCGTPLVQIEVMRTASDYTTVLNAVYQAQNILVNDVPKLVLSSRWDAYAYRTDRFDGWVELPVLGLGAANQWIPRKVRLLPNQPGRHYIWGTGGTFHTHLGSPMDSQNPLTTSAYGGYPLSQIYLSLTGLPDPRDKATTFGGGGLAYYWEISEESDHLRFDFTLQGADPDRPPAYWHDMGGDYGGRV
ncbi:MAG: hypothetical protein Q6361_05790, partial [Candidatus Hermodarchaeota archaeon]|nr:hypothetical protein [Candidatus Hermodarchaeota archaeon]